MKHPNFREEKRLWRKGYRIVAGLDESGRGPLAGPVVAAVEATKLAMKRAVRNLEKRSSVTDFLILDGNFEINTLHPQKSIIKADEKVFSCTAAGIIAKVNRDRIMLRYHKKYSQYGFDRHKGYPTKLHRKMLKKHGPSIIHRITFKLTLPGL